MRSTSFFHDLSIMKSRRDTVVCIETLKAPYPPYFGILIIDAYLSSFERLSLLDIELCKRPLDQPRSPPCLNPS
jgi:hypothetical protein